MLLGISGSAQGMIITPARWCTAIPNFHNNAVIWKQINRLTVGDWLHPVRLAPELVDSRLLIKQQQRFHQQPRVSPAGIPVIIPDTAGAFQRKWERDHPFDL